MYTDPYGRVIITEQDAIGLLYKHVQFDLSNCILESDKYNNSIDELFAEYEKTQSVEPLTQTIKEFDNKNQSQWFMPENYKQFDIAQHLLDLCKDDQQRQRVGQELLIYCDRNLFDLLKFLYYFVDVLKKNNIVWGVGRGSSVASYVLFLLEVHSVDSLYYDLDIHEFLR